MVISSRAGKSKYAPEFVWRWIRNRNIRRQQVRKDRRCPVHLLVGGCERCAARGAESTIPDHEAGLRRRNLVAPDIARGPRKDCGGPARNRQRKIRDRAFWDRTS